MTEPLLELRGLLRGLQEYGVDYVVFGAMGMVFYGYVRNTEDLDIAEPRRRESRPGGGTRERWGMHKGSNACPACPSGRSS